MVLFSVPKPIQYLFFYFAILSKKVIFETFCRNLMVYRRKDQVNNKLSVLPVLNGFII